jgi:hypothetical protein
MNTLKQIQKTLRDYLRVDKLICRGDGTFTVKEYYFYSHGMTCDSIQKDIETQLAKHGIKIRVTSKENHFNSWPKDSWMQVDFEVAAKPIEGKCHTCGELNSHSKGCPQSENSEMDKMANEAVDSLHKSIKTTMANRSEKGLS